MIERFIRTVAANAVMAGFVVLVASMCAGEVDCRAGGFCPDVPCMTASFCGRGCECLRSGSEGTGVCVRRGYR
jgi:hypothetical protein